MILYDGTSSIKWKTGELTVEQMRENPVYQSLLDNPSVLYDDGAGEVYSWILLSVLCNQNGVPVTDDAEADFATVQEKMSIVEPTLEEKIDEVSKQVSDVPALASFVTLSLPMVAPTVKDSALAPVIKYAGEYVPEGHSYKKGEVFKYTDGTYWRVSQDFKTQAQWVPGGAGLDALFYKIEIAPDGIIVWAQPRGEYDAPDKGDPRHYPNADSPVYISLVNDNAYSPDAVPKNWKLANDD